MNDIVEYVDGFYYLDDSNELVGPFKTVDQAQIALNASHKWQVREHKDDIRKMRSHQD